MSATPTPMQDQLIEVVLHTVGARSGRPRLVHVMAIPNNGSWLVTGTAGGRATDPGWVYNLRANPNLGIAVDGPRGRASSIAARASELIEPDRTAAWSRFTAASDVFVGHTARTSRTFPIFEIVPREGGADNEEVRT